MNLASTQPDLRFDHVGIVVSDLQTGVRLLGDMLQGLSWTRRFDDAGLGVSVQFACAESNVAYELIAPFGVHSPVASTLKSRTNLLNQIAYRTHVLTDSVRRLRAAGCTPIGRPSHAIAFGGAAVQFLMSPLGFIVELIEIDHCVHEFLSSTGD